MTLPQESPLIINIIVGIVIIVSLITGYIKGFLWQVLRIFGLIGIILLSYILSPGLSELVQIFPRKFTPFANTGMSDLFYDKINTMVWFIILLLVGLLIMAILKPLFKAVTEIPVIKGLNKTLGALLSLIPAFIGLLVFTYILNSAVFTNGKDMVNKSMLRYTNVVVDYASKLIKGAFKENVAIQKMINDPKSLTKDDLSEIVNWMKNSKIDSEAIREFLSNYGIDVEYINDLLNNDSTQQ